MQRRELLAIERQDTGPLSAEQDASGCQREDGGDLAEQRGVRTDVAEVRSVVGQSTFAGGADPQLRPGGSASRSRGECGYRPGGQFDTGAEAVQQSARCVVFE